MNTIHDENKIWDIIHKKVTKIITPEHDSLRGIRIVESDMEIAMQEYAEYIREKTIDECNEEIQDLKNLIQALEYKIESCEIELQAEITSRGIDNTNN